MVGINQLKLAGIGLGLGVVGGGFVGAGVIGLEHPKRGNTLFSLAATGVGLAATGGTAWALIHEANSAGGLGRPLAIATSIGLVAASAGVAALMIRAGD